MHYYELLYIIPAAEDIEATKARVDEIIKGQDMEVLRHEEAGRFRLAYPMRHVRQGVYYLAAFKGEPTQVASIEAGLRLEASVLRAMIARSSERALERRMTLAAFEQPVIDRSDRRRTPPRRGVRRPASVGAPTVTRSAEEAVIVTAAPQIPVTPAAEKMSEAEIDQQIDKILEEKVL
jgi:small subunit ribosomal protein S6